MKVAPNKVSLMLAPMSSVRLQCELMLDRHVIFAMPSAVLLPLFYSCCSRLQFVTIWPSGDLLCDLALGSSMPELVQLISMHLWNYQESSIDVIS